MPGLKSKKFDSKIYSLNHSTLGILARTQAGSVHIEAASCNRQEKAQASNSMAFEATELSPDSSWVPRHNCSTFPDPKHSQSILLFNPFASFLRLLSQKSLVSLLPANLPVFLRSLLKRHSSLVPLQTPGLQSPCRSV